MIASSSSAASTSTAGVSGSTAHCPSMRGPSVGATSASSIGRRSCSDSTSGCSGCRRAKASSWRVSRSPDATARPMAASCRLPSSDGSPRRSRCRLLLMTISRLLKSCATPPVSRPSASSFCDLPQRVLRARAMLGLLVQLAHRRQFALRPPQGDPRDVDQRHRRRERERGEQRGAALPGLQDRVARHAGAHVDRKVLELAELDEAMLAVQRPTGRRRGPRPALRDHLQDRTVRRQARVGHGRGRSAREDHAVAAEEVDDERGLVLRESGVEVREVPRMQRHPHRALPRAVRSVPARRQVEERLLGDAADLRRRDVRSGHAGLVDGQSLAVREVDVARHRKHAVRGDGAAVGCR